MCISAKQETDTTKRVLGRMCFVCACIKIVKEKGMRRFQSERLQYVYKRLQHANCFIIAKLHSSRAQLQIYMKINHSLTLTLIIFRYSVIMT